MRTSEKYADMGMAEMGRGKVQDKHGQIYYPKKARSPLQSIKLFCRECMGQSRLKPKSQEGIDLIRDCTDPMCPLCHTQAHNAKIPAHIGREEILEGMLDLLTEEVSRCRELIKNANSYLSGHGCGAVSVESAARLFGEMALKRTESNSDARKGGG